MVAGCVWSQEPVRYAISFQPNDHYLVVDASYPSAGTATIDLKMAVWTAYVIREYSQQVVQIEASAADGSVLSIRKTRKNRWQVETKGAPRVSVRYKLFCHSMHVQDNYVDGEFALINGQPTFLTLVRNEGVPHEVSLTMPANWKISISPMARIGDRRYRAVDYEQLVDSPIVAGNPAVYTFTVDGIEHRLVNIPDKGNWDAARVTGDLAKIVAAQRDVWGSLPYRDYTFFNVLSDKGGGMEHSSSTVMMASPNATRLRDGYLRWLSLASHELFHAWNVKRLRPREIAPGEYEEEQYTPSLGIAEGFTSYYGALSMRRAGIYSDGEFFTALSRLTEGLQRSEGRKLQTLAASSFDTWIKFYKPNEITPKTTVSYYTKGAVVGYVLDAKIRASSNGERSLDTVMREMLRRYPVERGYTLDEFAEVAGVDLKPWFFTTQEIDYSEADRYFGLSTDADGKVSPKGNNPNRERWLGKLSR